MDHLRVLTLKHVRRTIELFFKFYEYIQQTEQVKILSCLSFFSSNNLILKIRLSRCQSMLNRSNKSERIIENNARLCSQLQQEIDVLHEKLTKLESDLVVKKKSFTTVSFLRIQFQIIELF